MRFFSKKLFIGIVLVGYIHAKDLASIETALGIGSGNPTALPVCF